MIECGEPDPKMEEAIGIIEDGITRALKLLYDDQPDMAWMVEAFAVGVEAVGYNEEGKKFRIIEPIFPTTQSISATSGIFHEAGEGFRVAMAEMNDEEE